MPTGASAVICRKHLFELLEIVVAENDKQRFEYSDDRSLIRARQGHSVEVELGYESATPPDLLYHGTATKNLESIFQHGLIKGRRHHVHMSTNRETMLAVGGEEDRSLAAFLERTQDLEPHHLGEEPDGRLVVVCDEHHAELSHAVSLVACRMVGSVATHFDLVTIDTLPLGTAMPGWTVTRSRPRGPLSWAQAT